MTHARASEQLATELMNKLNTGAIPMIKANGGYTEHDGNLWRMFIKKRDGKPLGIILLVCTDEAALADFIRRAKAAGHKVGPTNRHDTVLITPQL